MIKLYIEIYAGLYGPKAVARLKSVGFTFEDSDNGRGWFLVKQSKIFLEIKEWGELNSFAKKINYEPFTLGFEEKS